jgi:hypothetical protein
MDKLRSRIQAQNYATMGIYNQGSQIRVPTPATSGLYVVPVFGTYGYNSLTRGLINNGGYFTLGTAYGDCGAQLTGTPYVRSACM